MASLTPQNRSGEVTEQAMSEGLTNGAAVLSASLAGLYAAMQNSSFVKLTNWQSRTAITIMPALFVFALTSEQKLSHRMHELAEETEHAIKAVEWADKEQRKKQTKDEEHLRGLYRQSVMASGVQLIDQPTLSTHHKVANYLQQNPFKCIAGIGFPAVVYVFYGRNQKDVLSLQMKILHTRVLGQFSVVCTLLGVMGLKEMMDRRGRYITEDEVNDRVEEMLATRQQMLDRLEYQASQAPTYLRKNLRKSD